MKIAIIGYGKMGKMIDQIATAKGHKIVLKIDRENAQSLEEENLKKADVAIEFTRPEAAFHNISKCISSGLPVVSGTTGWLDRKAEIEALCQEHGSAFLYASNFSIGVNIFFALNQFLAKMMDQQKSYEVKMEEIHHTQKLDAPSGTAISLANDIIDRVERKSSWINELSQDAQQLSLISKRIDQVPGTHSICYESEIDQIEIRHIAHSREGFAKGAIQAAEWIVGKKGCFSMKDVLGF